MSYIFRTSTYSTISKNYSEIKDKWDNKGKDVDCHWEKCRDSVTFCWGYNASTRFQNLRNNLLNVPGS
jgi:hypothetical protein